MLGFTRHWERLSYWDPFIFPSGPQELTGPILLVGKCRMEDGGEINLPYGDGSGRPKEVDIPFLCRKGFQEGFRPVPGGEQSGGPLVLPRTPIPTRSPP